MWPLETLRPKGVDVTVPEWPVTVSVSVAVVLPPPQTLATPPPPHDCGLVQDPQVRVPPQPSETEPQFLRWAAQLMGVQPLAAFTVRIAFRVAASGRNLRGNRPGREGSGVGCEAAACLTRGDGHSLWHSHETVGAR